MERVTAAYRLGIAQERERCAELARAKCRALGGDGYSAGAAAAWQILREITTVTTEQIYERLNPDDPIVRAVLAERARCAREFHFELHFVTDALEDGVLALDEEQVWIEPDRERVVISLTGAQLKLLAAGPSARARTAR
jgi:hypothetical protein